MPGETNWQPIYQLFGQVGELVTGFEAESEILEVTLELPGYGIELNQQYVAHEGVVNSVFVSGAMLPPDSDQAGAVDPRYSALFERLLLPDLLKEQGLPSEIWINAFAHAPEPQDSEELPFFLRVFYRDLGVLAEYVGVSERHGQSLRICPASSQLLLWLWPGGAYRTIKDARAEVDIYTEDGLREYVSLKESTGLDLSDFRGLFAVAGPSACLETPAELWP